MKINEQLELQLKCENQKLNQNRRKSDLMVKPEWWFAQLKQAVDSAPEWETTSNRLNQRNRDRTIRYKLVR